jgi:hypothetical protein
MPCSITILDLTLPTCLLYASGNQQADDDGKSGETDDGEKEGRHRRAPGDR